MVPHNRSRGEAAMSLVERTPPPPPHPAPPDDPPRPMDHTPGRGRREAASPRVIGLPSETDASEDADVSSRIRVLLVEDDPLFANLVISILQEASADFLVEFVPRLSPALASIARDRISLILADLQLPDSSGPITVRLLRGAA